MGSSFLEILQDPSTRKLLGFEAVHAEKTPFVGGVTSRLKFLLNDAANHLAFLKIGYTALEAFLQANVTGPPLDFKPEEAIIPGQYRGDDLQSVKEEIFDYLSVDGLRPYPLAPHIELFWLAKVILSNPTLAEAGFNGRRARMRVNFWHQKLLSEQSPTLRDSIYLDAEVLEQQLASRLAFHSANSEDHFVEFLVERATIRTYYGDDSLARADLASAATTRRFVFAVTGVLGKRTRFQDRDTSQLVVLAKSREPEPASGSEAEEQTSSKPSQPENVPLSDDTLLEQIQFSSPQSTQTPTVSEDTMTHVAPEDALPPELASLDPSNQPLLEPMDSIILLATASSITNTSPDDGLVREETLPYATRVLEGGSSNWQVYTQALLVRSRIEGYRARTAERGLLQLQALVDQVVAETSDDHSESLARASETSSTPTTFLPKPKASESASVAERLKYIYQLSPPLRWELEAELAARWTQMGGLKTALEIYERLQMHAEVALCLAATDREQDAIKLLKGLLFEDSESSAESNSNEADPSTSLKLRSPPPADAPRLLCILGDITGQPSYYTLAWNVSSKRYARAQRSLGRYFTKKRDFKAAAEAYTLALGIARLDRSSWFALGCVQLELQDYQGAVETFTRCVQLEDQDGEAWSNLAVALLKLPRPGMDVVEAKSDEAMAGAANTTSTGTGQNAGSGSGSRLAEDEEEGEGHTDTDVSRKVDPYRHVREALRALRRAATLKRDDARIWDNYLTVAASIPPSAGTPWNEVIQAMGRVIELRGKNEGEGAIDVGILKVLTEYVTQEWTYPTAASTNGAEESEGGEQQKGEDNTEPEAATTSIKLPYLPRAFLSLVDNQIAPLATSSPALYDLLCTISEWRNRPAQALLYAEKAWRTHLTRISLTENFDELTNEAQWTSVVDKTVWLIRRYRDLGPRERERTGGQVEPKWRFKAKSAARKVLGRAKAWEGTEAWTKLKEEMDALNE
ncbi:TPR repeat-containing protein C19B12.01 [Exophiala dermatitidis]